MEGDAGANRLNPNEADASTSEPDVGADQASTETTAEDVSEADVDQIAETNAEQQSGAEVVPLVEANPSRLGRGWFVGVAVVLVLLAGGVGAGGYFALHRNHEMQVIARHDAEALKAAEDCVAATQAPDIAAMAAAEQKIIDCSAGAFRAQAVLYSSLFVEAYQAANAHVEVSDMRAAVERNNTDGSVDVLVALRVKVSNSETQNKEAGYRLRVQMTPEEGQYRITKLDQVAK